MIKQIISHFIFNYNFIYYFILFFFNLISSPTNLHIIKFPISIDNILSSYLLYKSFNVKLVEITIFLLLSNLVLIILNNSVNLLLFIVSVPKSSIISKSTLNIFWYLSFWSGVFSYVNL